MDGYNRVDISFSVLLYTILFYLRSIAIYLLTRERIKKKKDLINNTTRSTSVTTESLGVYYYYSRLYYRLDYLTFRLKGNL